MLHLAIAREAFLIVVSDMRMYLLKQSLDQRPRACMSHFGQPAAAAVEAAPIRRECDEMFARPSVVLTRRALTSFRDKNRPF